MTVLCRYFLLIGFAVLGSQNALAAADGKFGFHNKTNKAIELGFGTEKNEPSQPYKEIKANESINDVFDRNDPPVIVIKTSTGEEFVYHFKIDPKAKKNIQLKWTTEILGKKTELLPQVIPGNISKSDIVLGKGSDAEEASTAKPEKKVAEKTSEDGDESAESEGEAEEAPAAKKLKVTPYDVLDINERLFKGEALQAKILGVKFASTIKDATLSEADNPHSGSKIKKARAEVEQAYEARKAIWDQEDGVSDDARKALERKKVTDASEQEKIAKATFQLIDRTYKAVTKSYSSKDSEDSEEP